MGRPRNCDQGLGSASDSGVPSDKSRDGSRKRDKIDYSNDLAGRLCERHESALLELTRLDDETLISIATTLSSAHLPSGAQPRHEVARALATTAATGINVGRGLADMLIDVVVASRASKTPLARLISNMVESFVAVNGDLQHFKLEDTLAKLVRTDVVTHLAVEEDLVAENAAVYIDARILRDFRPWYEEDLTTEPIGIARYVSQHRLRIRYWSEGRERAFEVTMRDDDLLDLESWLFRSKSKLPLVPPPVPSGRPKPDPGEAGP